MKMDWEILLDKDVQVFMDEHEGDDVAALALKKLPNKEWLYPLIFDQIKVRQKARLKTPKLRDTKGFVFPASFLYEQASSEACAAYKAQITRGLGDNFVDLTAGCGVDSFALAINFSQGALVEKNSQNSDLLAHNVAVMKNLQTQFDVKNMGAEEYVRELLASGEKVSLVYIDPQRREDVGGRKGLFDFELCSPNILELLPDLAKISDKVMIKTAPLLDIDRAVEQLGSCFLKVPSIDVHVLQWRGECKEVLYLLNFSASEHENGALITAVDLNGQGEVLNALSFHRDDERNARVCYAMPEIGDYICEPGPAFQKAGGFKYICEHFCINKLHQHTHLYVCTEKKRGFPGKEYKIVGIFSLKSKVLPVDCADLAIRNFPQSVATLRKKLRLDDGGKHRLYATTTYDNEHCLILCEKG
jgi:hypothetical protein